MTWRTVDLSIVFTFSMHEHDELMVIATCDLRRKGQRLVEQWQRSISLNQWKMRWYAQSHEPDVSTTQQRMFTADKEKPIKQSVLICLLKIWACNITCYNRWLHKSWNTRGNLTFMYFSPWSLAALTFVIIYDAHIHMSASNGFSEHVYLLWKLYDVKQ